MVNQHLLAYLKRKMELDAYMSNWKVSHVEAQMNYALLDKELYGAKRVADRLE